MRDEISRLAQNIFVATLASVLGCLVMFLSLTWKPTEIRALPVRWLGGADAPAEEVATAFVPTIFVSDDDGISVAECSSLDLLGLLVPRCPIQRADLWMHSRWTEFDRVLLASRGFNSTNPRLRIGVADAARLGFVLAVVDHCRGLGFADVELASAASDIR